MNEEIHIEKEKVNDSFQIDQYKLVHKNACRFKIHNLFIAYNIQFSYYDLMKYVNKYG